MTTPICRAASLAQTGAHAILPHDAVGTVRVWHTADGGVIDSAATPGACWAHYSVVLTEGYKSLQPGQDVRFNFEAAEQDGYTFRAVEAWPAEESPVPMSHVDSDPSSAYRSTLTLTFDDEDFNGSA